MHFIRLACVIVGLAFLCAPIAQAASQSPAGAGAAEETKAAETVSRIRQLSVEIEREPASREAKQRKWDDLKSLIDGEAMAQFVLGEHLSTAAPPQRAAVISALSDLVVDGLVERLGGVHAEPFELSGTRTLDSGDIVVVSHVQFRDGHRGELDWRLHAKGDGEVMVDVLVDGASVAVRARDEAAAELASNGGSLPRLTASMKNRLRFR